MKIHSFRCEVGESPTKTVHKKTSLNSAMTHNTFVKCKESSSELDQVGD